MNSIHLKPVSMVMLALFSAPSFGLEYSTKINDQTTLVVVQQSQGFTVIPAAYTKPAAGSVVLVTPPAEKAQDLLDEFIPITAPMVKSYAKEEALANSLRKPGATPKSQDAMQEITENSATALSMDSVALSQSVPASGQQGTQQEKSTDDLWSHLRAGFSIPDLHTSAVQKQIAAYTANPDEIARASKRASKYLFHVMQEIDKRHMPMELALLPFVESSFDPLAFSSAKASGIWQFMPATGQHFNLQRNLFKDDRRDVVASTDAALNYLQYLHDMFGDWHLALAAYNWGEGSVQKAIKKNRAQGRGTDFVSLSTIMPAETRNYVPRLLAYKAIISNPKRYGIALEETPYHPYFAMVPKTKDIDMRLAAKLADIPESELRALNPQFNRPVITGSNTKILLPLAKVSTFLANISKWTSNFSSWTAHTIIHAGSKIESIAERFGTTPEALRLANNIPESRNPQIGSTILVPRIQAMNMSMDDDISDGVIERASMNFSGESNHITQKKRRKIHYNAFH